MDAGERGIPEIETGLPGSLNAETKKRLKQTAIQVFKLFECRDYARVDFRVDRDGRPYVIDVNPNPDISPRPDCQGRSRSRA